MDEYGKATPPDLEDQGGGPDAPLIKGGWLRAVLILLSFILVQGLFGMVGLAVIYSLSGLSFETARNVLNGPDPWGLFAAQFFALIGTFLLVWLFRTKVDRRSIRSLGLSLRFRPLFLGLLLGLLMMGACAMVLYLAGHLGMNWQGVDPVLLGGHLLLALTIAVNEEFLVRGYVLTNLMDSMKPWVALVASAFVFTLLHVFNPAVGFIPVLNLFLAGLLLGVTYLHDRRLAFPIGLHLGWNFSQGHLFGFPVSGMNLDKASVLRTWTEGPSYLTGGEFGLEGSILLLGLQVLLIPSIYWLWKKMQ